MAFTAQVIGSKRLTNSLHYILLLYYNFQTPWFCFSTALSSHIAFTAQVIGSVSEIVDFQAVPHFISHSSTAPWSGVCSRSCWPRMFNVFLLGSLDDLIVSKLGLWVVTLKLAPNAARYYFGCLLSFSISHVLYIYLCVLIFCREDDKPASSEMFCRCKAGSVVAIWKSACRPGMEN